jgi:hypothetical protein
MQILTMMFLFWCIFRETKLLNELNGLLKNDAIIRNVFQHLVLESGVNWATDRAFARVHARSATSQRVLVWLRGEQTN